MIFLPSRMRAKVCSAVWKTARTTQWSLVLSAPETRTMSDPSDGATEAIYRCPRSIYLPWGKSPRWKGDRWHSKCPAHGVREGRKARRIHGAGTKTTPRTIAKPFSLVLMAMKASMPPQSPTSYKQRFNGMLY